MSSEISASEAVQRLEDGKELRGGVIDRVRRTRAGAVLASVGPGGELAPSTDMGTSVVGATSTGGTADDLNRRIRKVAKT